MQALVLNALQTSFNLILMRKPTLEKLEMWSYIFRGSLVTL